MAKRKRKKPVLRYTMISPPTDEQAAYDAVVLIIGNYLLNKQNNIIHKEDVSCNSLSCNCVKQPHAISDNRVG